jgi:PhnB protein
MVEARPDGYPGATPYLNLIARDASAAIAFYQTVFGARERMRLPKPGSGIGHAELKFEDSLIMLVDEAPEHNAVAPRDDQNRSVSIHLYVMRRMWRTCLKTNSAAEWPRLPPANQREPHGFAGR